MFLLAAAPLALLLPRYLGAHSGVVLALVPLATGGRLLLLRTPMQGAGSLAEAHLWLPAAELSWLFVLDGLTLWWALPWLWGGALALLALGYERDDDARLGWWLGGLLLLLAAGLLLLLAGNTLTLLAGWMGGALLLYMLLLAAPPTKIPPARPSTKIPPARPSATVLLTLLAGAGGLLAVGLLMFAEQGRVAGLPPAAAYALAWPEAQAATLSAARLYIPAVLLLALAGATLAGLVPLHGWKLALLPLPGALSGFALALLPLLGVYVLLRLTLLLADELLWGLLLALPGALTLLVAGLAALRAPTAQGVWGALLTSQAGGLVLLTGARIAPGPLLAGALVYGLAGLALALLLAQVQHTRGTDDLAQPAGLLHTMPATSWLLLLALLALACAPLLALLGAASWLLPFPLRIVLAVLLLLGTALGLASCARLGYRLCTRGAATPTRHEAPVGSLLAPGLLLAGLGAALLGVLLGGQPFAALFALAETTVQPLATSTAAASSREPGVGLPVALLLLTLLLGGLAAFQAQRLADLPGLPARWHVAAVYAASGRALDQAAGRLVRWVHPAEPRTALALLFGLWLALVGPFVLVFVIDWTALRDLLLDTSAWPARAAQWGLLPVGTLLGLGLLLTGVLLALRTPTRLAAVLGLAQANAGLMVVLALAGAPTLALVYALVGGLALLLLLLLCTLLPVRFLHAAQDHANTRPRDALLALGVGGLTALLVYHVGQASTLPDNQLTLSVQTILVQVRGLDMLGATLLLLLALLGATHVLRGPVPPAPDDEEPW